MLPQSVLPSPLFMPGSIPSEPPEPLVVLSPPVRVISDEPPALLSTPNSPDRCCGLPFAHPKPKKEKQPAVTSKE